MALRVFNPHLLTSFPDTQQIRPNSAGNIGSASTHSTPSARRSAQAEQKAKSTGAENDQSVMMIAYGLRPSVRDMSAEQRGIISFIKVYGRLPDSTLDWNILRSFVY